MICSTPTFNGYNLYILLLSLFETCAHLKYHKILNNNDEANQLIKANNGMWLVIYHKFTCGTLCSVKMGITAHTICNYNKKNNLTTVVINNQQIN